MNSQLSAADCGDSPEINRAADMNFANHHLPRPFTARTFSHPAQTSDRLWPSPDRPQCTPALRHCKTNERNAVTHCLSIAESTAAVQNVLDLSLKGDFDALLEYVPDTAVEHALQRKRIFRCSPISLRSVWSAMHHIYTQWMPLGCSVLWACIYKQDTVRYRRSEKGDSVSFPEMAVMSQPGFSIGAHAMRGLIFSQPSRIEVSQINVPSLDHTSYARGHAAT